LLHHDAIVRTSNFKTDREASSNAVLHLMLKLRMPVMIQPGGQHPLSPSSQVRAHRCPNSSVERTSHAVPTFKDDEAAGIVPVNPK
jgi:hypothetical protein